MMPARRQRGRRETAGALIRLACVCALALVATGTAHSQETVDKRIDNKQRELEKIKSEIEERRKKTQALKKEESQVLKTLSSLDKEIDLSKRVLSNLAQQQMLVNEKIDSLQNEIAYETDVLASGRVVLAKRLREMYKRDPRYEWEVILGSDNIQAAVRRYKFMKLIAERDAALIAEVKTRKHTFEVETAALTESLAEMVMLRDQQETENQRLERGRRRRQTMLSQVRTQRKSHEKAIQDLEKAQEEVKDLIGQLETRRLADGTTGLIDPKDFTKLKGRMIRPVDGKIRRGYGQQRHPKFGTVTFNNGVDIAAAEGTPIRAVASGVVEFVDWIDAYGKCVILNHGGGYYTLYAHVAATFVSQGQKISAGEVIAEVGDTGSLNGFECHFEIRKSKKALNPLDWFGR